MTGLPIYVARIPAAPFPRAPLSLTHDLPGSFALSGYPVYLATSQSARFSSGHFPSRPARDMQDSIVHQRNQSLSS